MLLFSFFVSTISLAAVNSELKSDVAALRQQLYDIENPTTTTQAPSSSVDSSSVSVTHSTTELITDSTTPLTSESTDKPTTQI